MALNDSQGALSELGNCKLTSFLRDGFEKVKEFEGWTNERMKSQLAYASAWSFLQHEQTLHLQAMIYSHPDFRFAWDNNDFGRSINSVVSITGASDPDLIFNAAPSITPQTESAQLVPVGLTASQVSERMSLDDGKLYEPAARMKYVERILSRYHRLMRLYRPYKIGQMNVIKGWKDAT
jgi:hypothetical protein